MTSNISYIHNQHILLNSLGPRDDLCRRFGFQKCPETFLTFSNYKNKNILDCDISRSSSAADVVEISCQY